jgi:hypothetical protein
MTENEKRRRVFHYSNENPIKISNNGAIFSNFVLDDLIFCGGDANTYNEIWSLELSQTPWADEITYKNYEKEQNRVVALFNPKFTFSLYNRDEGSLMVFDENRKINVTNTNELFLYVKNVNDGNLIDLKDLTYLIIYSF